MEDLIRSFAKCLARNAHKITPHHLSIGVTAYVADSKAEAVREIAPYHLYFLNRTLFSHGNFTGNRNSATPAASQSSNDYVRPKICSTPPPACAKTTAT